MTDSPGLRYLDARRLVVGGGTALLAVMAVLAWAQGVDPAEAVGVALYMPVFLAAALLGPAEGIGVAVLACAAYVGLRIPAIRVVGFSRLSGLLATRAGFYLAFGAIIGFAAQRLNASLSHLERHDMVDDVTGLHNARWFLQATDAEMNRVQRALDPERGFLGYGSVFSVVAASVSNGVFDGREGARLLADVGAQMAKGLRRSDRPVHAADDFHHFVLLLPGTATVGAGVVAERTVQRLRDLLAGKPTEVTSSVITYPDNPEALDELRERFGRIDASERPPA
jgi:GGDEF domain-containing protein